MCAQNVCSMGTHVNVGKFRSNPTLLSVPPRIQGQGCDRKQRKPRRCPAWHGSCPAGLYSSQAGASFSAGEIYTRWKKWFELPPLAAR